MTFEVSFWVEVLAPQIHVFSFGLCCSVFFRIGRLLALFRLSFVLLSSSDYNSRLVVLSLFLLCVSSVFYVRQLCQI